MITFKNELHPLLEKSIKAMIVDIKYKVPFYGELNLEINFEENNRSIETCGVNATKKGLYFYFNSNFLSSLNTKDGKLIETKEEQDEQLKQVNFIVIHEDFHILFDHPQRTVLGKFNPYLSNIAQDMIINSIIHADLSSEFVSVPKYPDNEENRKKDRAGKNMALFLPKGYDEEPIFEILYNWLNKKKENYNENKKNGKKDQCLICDGSGKKSTKNRSGDIVENDCKACDGKGVSGGYGEYGSNTNGKGLDTYSLNDLFENIEQTKGQYMDIHMEDEVPKERRESMVDSVLQKLRSRGLEEAHIKGMLRKLRKKKKDYLREIKSAFSNKIGGSQKQKTISRPNRRSIVGIKGYRKVSPRINLIWDTSGSMSGLHEKVLEYVFRSDIEINVCQVDTIVHSMKVVKSMKALQLITVEGFGGTVLQPAIDLISKHKEYKKLNTVILTDGHCDKLDFSDYHGKVLIISAGVHAPIKHQPKYLRQIITD